MKKRQPLQVTVKDIVDLVFELTTSTPGGNALKVQDFGSCGYDVVKVLVGRGILERIENRTFPRTYTYKWAVASAPTNVLYGSIAQEIRDYYKRKKELASARRKSMEKSKQAESKIEPETASEPVVTPADPLPSISIPNTAWSLSSFSIQELWDELKGRGCVIIENKLALPTVQYQYFN